MIKSRYILALMLIVFWVSVPCHANWAIHFGGDSSDTAKSIEQTQEGGFILAGQGGSHGGYLITKFSSDGTVTWKKEYVLEGIFDTAQSIKQTRDGGYIVAGMSSSFYEDKIWMLKLGELGEIEWQKQTIYEVNPSFTARAYSVQETFDKAGPDGSPDGYIIAGSTIHLTGQSWDVWVIRLNLKGTFAWQKTYGLHTDGGYSIDQTFDLEGNPDGFILAGSTGYFGGDAFILRLDPDGKIIWERIYGGSSENAYSIKQTRDGGFIVAGSGKAEALAPGRHFWVAKLDPAGIVQWQKVLGGETGEDVPFSIEEVVNAAGNPNGYIIAGETSNFGAGQKDVWIVKVDLNGNIAWQKTYGGELNESANSIQQTFDSEGNPDGYALAGYTWSFGNARDVFFLKLNANGEIPDCEMIGTSAATTVNGDLWFPSTPPVTNIEDSDAVLLDTDSEAVIPNYTTVQICYSEVSLDKNASPFIPLLLLDD